MLECYPMKGNRGMENLSDSIDYLNYHWFAKGNKEKALIMYLLSKVQKHIDDVKSDR